MKRIGSTGPYLVVGVLAALSLALTTDQILNNVYNSSSQALTVKVVGGSGPGTGTVTGTGTAPRLAAWSSTSALTNYAGDTTCTGLNALQQLSNAGVGTCIPVPPSGGSVDSPVAIVLANAGTTGTTANKLVKVKTDGTAVITATTDTVGAIGIALPSGGGYAPGTTGSVKILLIGVTSCVFDNAVTSGDFIGISSGTAGDCTDLGSAFPSEKSVLGIVLETNVSAGTRSVLLATPDIMNTTNIKGGNPGKGNITDLVYSGTLKITDINTVTNGDATLSHRYTRFSTGNTARVATLPAASGSGVVYDVCKLDSGTGTVAVTRAGTDVIINKTNGSSTTLTLTGRGACQTLYDQASGEWLGRGDGT